MRSLRILIARVRGIFAGPLADDGVREELASHVDMQAAEYVRRGMHPADARRVALATSGGLTVASEAVREQRGVPLLESISTDVRLPCEHSAVRRPTRSSRSRRSRSASGRIPRSSAWSVVSFCGRFHILTPDRLMDLASTVNGSLTAVSVS